MQDLHVRSLAVTDGVGHPIGLLSIDEMPPEAGHSPLSLFDVDALRAFAAIGDSHPH
jgi:hypothetical protein